MNKVTIEIEKYTISGGETMYQIRTQPREIDGHMLTVVETSPGNTVEKIFDTAREFMEGGK